MVINLYIFKGSFCYISSGSTLYSCTIEDEVHVGFKCVILEGAKLEKGNKNLCFETYSVNFVLFYIEVAAYCYYICNTWVLSDSICQSIL